MTEEPMQKVASTDVIDLPSSSAEEGRPAARRNLLRLVVGGVPLLSTTPVAANLAAGSAWRAVREDAKARPNMVSATQDGWVRSSIDVVEVRISDPLAKAASSVAPTNTTAGATTAGATTVGTTTVGTTGGSLAPPPAPTIQAYKFGAPTPRYYQISGLMPINGAYVQEVGKVGQVYSLVLFDSSGGIVGVDPGRALGAGLQGLHCSSWRSISPTAGNFPGCSGV